MMGELKLTGREECALHRCATALSRFDMAAPMFTNGRLTSVSLRIGDEHHVLYLVNGEWTTLETMGGSDGEA